MAKTRTKTKARTKARTRLIEMQIRRVFLDTTSIAESSLDGLLKGVRKKWIRSFKIIGLNEEGECCAQLSLELDWSEHELQLRVGNRDVAIPKSWREDISVQVSTAIATFNDYAEEFSLEVTWSVIYVEEAYDDPEFEAKIDRKLGLTRTKAKKWAGKKAAARMNIHELPELTVGVELLDE